MKKLFGILAVFFILASFVSAKETLEENMRVEFVLGDAISTNLLSMANTTNAAVEVTTYNNNVGFILGAMFRESTLVDFEQFGKFRNFSWNPYIGIELWNNELDVGAIFYPSDASLEQTGVAPYVAYSYMFDVIKPKTGVSNSLSIKLGAEWYPDLLSADSGEASDGLASVFIMLLSIVIPKVNVGVQYKVGYGWGY